MITVAEYERAELELGLREMKRGWRIHATVYVVVMTGLIVLNLVLAARTEADFLWFFFPLVCWGIGLTLHHVGVTRWATRDIRARQKLIEQAAESTER